MKQVYKYKNSNNLLLLEVCQFENEKFINFDKGLFRVIWSKKGSGTVLKEECKEDFQERQMFFCNPYHAKVISSSPNNIIYTYSFPYEILARLMSCFMSIDFLTLFLSHEIDNTVTLGESKAKNLIQLNEDILIESNRSSDEKEDILMIILAQIILLYKRELNAIGKVPTITTGSDSNNIINQFYQSVEMSFKSSHKVADYAKLLNVSNITLSNAFRNHPMSAIQVIHKRLLVEAKRLLEYSDLSIKQITFILGFQEPSHFHKFFKKNTSITPLQYRKNCL